MAVSKLNPAAAGIPYGDNAGRPANAETGQPYFNGEVGRLELYSSNGWQNIVQETPGVASASGTYNESAGSGTFTVSGTNFVDGAIAYAVGTNGTEYQATTTTYNSIVQLTVVFSNLSSAYEPYDIKITNPSNLFGLLPDAFYINDSPVWSTAAGSLGTLQNGSVSIQLSATDDESNTLSYAVSSGSLPTGLSLSSTGLLSGTMSANVGTYSFNISVSDGINTSVSRSFTITVPAPVVSGGTLTSDATYYYRTFNSSDTLSVSNNILIADFMVIGGGGGGGWNNAGGGGAGGYIETLSYALPSGSHAVIIGSGGAAFSNGGSVTPAGSGVDTTLGSIFTAKGGGGGNSWTSQASAAAGGSGGGSSGNPTGIYAGGAATQPSQAGISGSSGFGSAGGAGGSAQGGNDVGGGGGGGAGGVGQPSRGFGYADYIGSGAPGGHGGLGKVSALDGVTRAGGGGGGAGGDGTGSYWSGKVNGGTGGGGPSAAWSTSNTREVGLAGAGNGGSAVRSKAGGHATANTGSGGGGGDNTDGGNGGSGVVVIRYTRARVGG